jgi:DNA invertase Pin-like site-specific DNA recombinase
MKPQAIGYHRFSSKAQATGNSELRQEAGFAEFVARSGLALGLTYIDRGESAFHGNHRGGEFGRLLTDCASKKFPSGSVVWFEDMDRFSRQKLGVVLADWLTITSAGYGIHISSLGTTYTEHTDQMEMMGVIMKSILAHDEGKKRSVRGKAARQRIRETGRTKPKVEGEQGRRLAACPFWLTVGADGEYRENDYALVVKEMFRLSAEGHGAGEVSNMLGNPTRPVTRTVGKGKDAVKIKVNATIDVLGVLRNRAVIGEYRPAIRVGKNRRDETKEVKEGYYPVVVPVELFNEVQFGLDGRRKQRGRKGKAVSNLFTELLHGSDGLPMHLKIESSGRHVLRRKTKGSNRTWDYKQVEYTLLRFLRELRLTGMATSPVEAYEHEKAQLEKRLEEVTALQEEYPSAANARTMQKLEGRIAEVADKIELEQQRIPETTSLDQTHGVLTALETAQGDELLSLRTRLKMLIRRLVASVDVFFGVQGKLRFCRMVVRLTNGEVRDITLAGKKVEYNHVQDKDGTTEVWRVKVTA